MNWLWVIIAVLLATAPPAAGQSSPDRPAAEADAAQQIQPPREQPPAEKPPGPETEKKQADWPRPFIPTERISADSVVSFPTDI